MAQGLRVLAAKTDNQSSIPGAYMVERINSHKLSFDLHTHSVTSICAPLPNNKMQKWGGRGEKASHSMLNPYSFLRIIHLVLLNWENHNMAWGHSSLIMR